ncbi:hypothetical protein C4D60_Mb03t13770 [Musa balbisiana]|uniref:Uncharacterized protein n=1 Tax=Musa balbisiana TaxID=52838 RepID=A0A4S8J9P9_MUSBA|nr:hypothetical protein C4D60_Mb03t13770 [Musa balbisiana]
MTEQWLIEAGLSLMPRGTSLAGSLGILTNVRFHPCTHRLSRESARKIRRWRSRPVGLGRRQRPALRRDLTWLRPHREEPRKPSIQELYRLLAGAKDEPYQAQAMGDLPEGKASDPLGGLSRKKRVWADGGSTTLFIRGGFHPDMAREMYTLSSEVLLGKSAKSLLWGQHYAMVLMDRVRDAGQVEEIRASATPEAVATAEQRASDLETEATRLRSKVKAAKEQNDGLQVHLKAARAEVRLAKGETLTLTHKLDEARVEVRTASEALADEIRQRSKKDRKLIEDYNKSKGFELELTRTGQVTYEYGYHITLARFRVRYPDLEVAEDPFASFPEDLGINMPEERQTVGVNVVMP